MADTNIDIKQSKAIEGEGAKEESKGEGQREEEQGRMSKEPWES